MLPIFTLGLKYLVMDLAAAHAWFEHHQKLLRIRPLGTPDGFTMGDTTVRRPGASHFEKGVDFGLIVHKSPFTADKKDPLVRSNYIFELLGKYTGGGLLIQVESVTAHAENGAG